MTDATRLAASRVCSLCRERKPHAAFSSTRGTWCKPCNRRRRKELRDSNPELHREVCRRYRATHVRPSGPPHRPSPERQYARRCIERAIKSGQMAKPLCCEQCGNEPQSKRRLQAHHEDYSQPLVVQWLCSRCHGLKHRLPPAPKVPDHLRNLPHDVPPNCPTCGTFMRRLGPAPEFTCSKGCGDVHVG